MFTQPEKRVIIKRNQKRKHTDKSPRAESKYEVKHARDIAGMPHHRLLLLQKQRMSIVFTALLNESLFAYSMKNRVQNMKCCIFCVKSLIPLGYVIYHWIMLGFS